MSSRRLNTHIAKCKKLEIYVSVGNLTLVLEKKKKLKKNKKEITSN